MTINNKSNKPPVSTAPTTSNNNAVEPTIEPFIIPIGERRTNNDGLDWLRKPSNDLPSNVVVTRGEISMRSPDGSMHVMDTYTTGEGWHSSSKNDMNRRYDGRYEGRSTGYHDDPDNFSTSGLKVRSTRNNSSDDNYTVQP